MRPFFLLITVIWLLGMPLSAQEPESRRRIDHGERARPSMEEERKEDLLPVLISPPISDEFGLFLNRNMIEESSTLPQNESSIAINPLAPNVLISSAVDGRNGAIVYISTNGGLSWTNRNLGVVHPNWQTGNDPSVAFDYQGNGYMMYGAFPRAVDGNFTGESGVYLAKTTDNGVTWQPHIVVIEHVGAMTLDSAFEDKYYVEIDNSAASPYRGNLYTPWKRVTDRDSATQIVFTRSVDGGLTWSEPIPVSPRKPGTSKDTTFGQSFPLSTTGPDGTVYVVWNDGPIRSLGFARSTDGGRTFSPPSYPVQGYPTLGTARQLGEDVYHVLKGTFRAETYPTMMADNSTSPRRGWLYLAWAAGTNPDVYFIRSTDGGTTWTQPKVIHSDPRNDQWWPWLSVDEATGDIAVMYSDSRNDPENILIDTYVSYSSDGGDTWIDRRATDAMSDFRRNPYVGGIFAGDYSGNAFLNGKVYPSFLDTRGDNDVYTAVVHIRQPYPVEDLVVRGRFNDLTEAILSWRNPPLETVFGLPVADYKLEVARDGAPIALLPAGTTSYSDPGRSLGGVYRYQVRVVVGADSSVTRNVIYTPGDALLPARPVVTELRDYKAEVELVTRIPALRADSATPLGNLQGYRLYRDGEMVAERPLSASDTGRTITITDIPPGRGYYRYAISIFDAAAPAAESFRSDTMIAYAGPVAPYTESFDGADPRFLLSGTWGETSSLALSAPESMTDSPTGNYQPNRVTAMQIYPVPAPTAIELRFAHIAIVDKGDSAFVEASFDRGATWSRLRNYNTASDPAWADQKADPGDWRQEVVNINHPSPGPGSTVVIRFRLRTSGVTNLDGWYVDDISFGGPAGVNRGERAAFASRAYPNPAHEAAIIEYTLRSSSPVEIRVFDVMGREVALLQDEPREAGRHAVTFDGSALPNGVYIYEITAGTLSERGRIVLAH